MIQSWDVPRLSTEESFAVLASRRPDLRGAANDPALRQIVEAADGDDFALELCIAYFARPSNPAPSELASALCGGTSSKSHPFFDSNLRGRVSGDLRSVACVLSASWADLPEGPELALLRCAAWCAEVNIPLSLLETAAGLGAGEGVKPAERLYDRSIVRLQRVGDEQMVSLSRPVQTVLQITQTESEDRTDIKTLSAMLTAMIDRFTGVNKSELYSWRTAAWPHAESLVRHTEQLAIPEDLASQSATLRAELSGHLRILGQVPAALGHINASMAWCESQQTVNQPLLAEWRVYRARIKQFADEFADAESDIQESIDWMEGQPTFDQAKRGSWYAFRGRIRQLRGSLSDAEDDVTRGIGLAANATNASQRDIASWYGWRGHIRAMSGDLAGARSDIERCMKWYKDNQPEAQRAFVVWLAISGYVHWVSGDLVKAEEEIRTARDWYSTQVPPSALFVASCRADRAAVLRDIGRYDEAAQEVALAFEWFASQTASYEWRVAGWQGTRATIRARTGDIPGAVKDIQQCINWHRANQPRNIWGLSRYLKDQGFILATAADWVGARAAIAESVTLHEAAFGKDYPWTVKAREFQTAIQAGHVPK
jgi:tetratricopeptide (TPR) repeat protein